MKIAYLILAHNNPKLIKKMTEILSYEDCAFFIHIDSKSDINDFSSIRGTNVFFIDKRVPVYWGEYSMVEAILALIQNAIVATQNYDYFVLMSGSDYPLRDKEYINNFFKRYRGIEFISLKKIPNNEAGLPISKINNLRIKSSQPIFRFIFRVLAILGFAKRDYRKHLGTLQPYGGSTWWALTRDACIYILDFVKNNEQFCRFFEKTFTSDEMFFHTILGNSIFTNRIQRCLTYDDWLSVGPHPAHPAMINDKHITFFEENNKVVLNDIFGPGEILFARKYSDDNLNLVLRIDDMIKNKRKTDC